MAASEHVDDGLSCNRDEVLLAFNHHHEIMGGIICSRPLVVLILTLVSRSVAACVHLLMSAWVFLWHAVHDGYLGNVPPGRLQVHGLWISNASSIWQRLLSERKDVQGLETKPTQT